MSASSEPVADDEAAAPGGARRILRPLLNRFLRDRSGNVAMMFGLLMIPLVAIVGLAIDFGRVYSVRFQTQAALAAGALAAARMAQISTSNITTQAQTAATAYFNQAKPSDVVTSTLTFSPNSANTQFTVTADSWVRTPFLSVLNYLFHQASQSGAPSACQGNGFGCVSVTTTATAALCPSDACSGGGNGGSNVEIALMLDVTGSMCSPCTKIQAVQSAAKDLINIVVWADQSQYYSRVALAPFADAVNVGSTLAPLVRRTVTNNTSSTPQTFTSSDMSNTAKQPTSKWIKYPKASGSGTNTWMISSKCVTERIGAQAYTDASPATAFVGKGYFGANDTSCTVAGSYSDAEINSIFPLTNDTTSLNRRIDKLATGGSTAGHLGTAWAWYLLSPNWNTVFQQAFPSSYAAGSYSDLTTLNSNGAPKLRKIAVLMTDGDYNINYCKGVQAKDSDQTPAINCNSENGK